MLCQGMDFVFSNSDFLTDEPGAYPGWPQATAAIAVSDAIDTFLRAGLPRRFPPARRARADRGLVPAGREGEAHRPDAAAATRGPARSGPAHPALRSARRLGDRADRRDDAAAGGRRARSRSDLPVRCRARRCRSSGRGGDGVRLLRGRLHRRRREGVHAAGALVRHRRLRCRGHVRPDARGHGVVRGGSRDASTSERVRGRDWVRRGTAANWCASGCGTAFEAITAPGSASSLRRTDDAVALPVARAGDRPATTERGSPSAGPAGACSTASQRPRA